jgi:hypothetical protein
MMFTTAEKTRANSYRLSTNAIAVKMERSAPKTTANEAAVEEPSVFYHVA